MAMNRIAIPTTINNIPEKYLTSENLGKENAMKIPIVMDKRMTTHITLTEFLSYETASDFFDLVKILIRTSESNQIELITIIAIE